FEKAISKLTNRDPKKPSRKWSEIHQKISPVLQQACGRLYNEQEMIALLSLSVSNDELENLKKQFWRGTFAAIVYSEIRNLSVHWFGPPDAISFDKTTFRDKPIPPIDFSMVHPCLKCVAFAAREKSISTEKWFGHDFE
ncbi:MAG: hypothetical protein V1897_17975, partial [Pseudomonadota bacterium]